MSTQPWKTKREDRWRTPKLPRAKRRQMEIERRQAVQAAGLVPVQAQSLTAPPPLTEAAYIQFLEEAMKWPKPSACNIVYMPGGLADWIEREYGPRADGLPPDDAVIRCHDCGDEWWFNPIPYGGCEVAPCGHYFLQHMTQTMAAFANVKVTPGLATYRRLMEPPQ